MDIDTSHRSSSSGGGSGSDTDGEYDLGSPSPHRGAHPGPLPHPHPQNNAGRYSSQRLEEQAEKKFRTDGPVAALQSQSGSGSTDRSGDAFIEQCKV
jgi:hypothetical protein